MTDLDKLIAAVEDGRFGTGEFDLCETALPRSISPAHYVMQVMQCGSLDAAKALHEALLPGWEYTLDAGDGALVESRADFGVSYSVDASRGSMARCWLLATLKAYRSTQEASQ